MFIHSDFAKECSLFYELKDCDEYEYGINSLAKCCFFGSYTCNSIDDSLIITIPDTYDGYKVTKLGGYVGKGCPAPFTINFGKQANGSIVSGSSVSEDNNFLKVVKDAEFGVDVPYNVKEIKFTLNIGKYIDKIYSVHPSDYFPHCNEDGSVTYYNAVMYVKCSDENKSFYSKDGRLYDKHTDTLVDKFTYE